MIIYTLLVYNNRAGHLVEMLHNVLGVDNRHHCRPLQAVTDRYKPLQTVTNRYRPPRAAVLCSHGRDRRLELGSVAGRSSLAASAQRARMVCLPSKHTARRPEALTGRRPTCARLRGFTV